MSLFKKKPEEKSVCACNGGCTTSEVDTISKTDTCCCEATNSICCIKILGSGCKSCHALLENTQKAISNMGLSVEVEYVTDMEKIMGYSESAEQQESQRPPRYYPDSRNRKYQS